MPARSLAPIRRACFVVLPALLVVGCAGTETASTPSASAAPSMKPQFGATKEPGLARTPESTPSDPGRRTPAARPPVAAVPAGARYTIMCRAFPDAASAATSKDNLIQATGRREFYVVHEEAQSTIYFGYYREYQRAGAQDPKEAARADADLAYLKSLGTPDGQALFARSLFVPLPAADPEAPAEYDLARLDSDKDKSDPNRKYWSIAIAAYTADAVPTGTDVGKNRKQLAVESVMAARKMGVEAYYYNGPSISMVCVGAWPRKALRAQMSDTDVKRYDNGDPILLSNVPLPDKLRKEIADTGKKVNIVEPDVVVEDPTLLETWKQYLYYEVNGKTDVAVTNDPVTGQRKEQIKNSFLIEIPMAQSKDLLTAGRNTQAAQPDVAPETNPLLPGQGVGGNRLRSVRP